MSPQLHGRQPEETAAFQEAFLAAFSKTGTIRSASKALKALKPPISVSREIVTKWIANDYLDFAYRFKLAQREFAEYLEDLALTYVEQIKPGQNPMLLLAMLNASWPDKYRPKVVIQDDSSVLRLLDELRSIGAASSTSPPPLDLPPLHPHIQSSLLDRLRALPSPPTGVRSTTSPTGERLPEEV